MDNRPGYKQTGLSHIFSMRRASSSPFILSPVAHSVSRLLVCATLGAAPAVHAQLPAPEAPAPAASAPEGPPEAAAALKASPRLADQAPRQPENQGPTFVFGDRLTGRPNLETVVEGDAEIRRGDASIRADRIEYDQPEDLFKSRGNVRINKAGNRFEGPELELKLERFEGFFTQPNYRFLATGGNGQAERLDFVDDRHMTAQRATYTTCERDNEASWQPAWVLRADQVDFDLDKDVGVATNAVLRFKGVPILGFPTVSFPLSDKRKSGFLPPTIGLGSSNGFEYRQPYYFDIAPNRDATISPAILTKRGIDVAGEFRYLEPKYRGELRANFLPNDRVRDRDRWSYGLLHSGALSSGVSGIGDIGLSLNLNRVSDDNYWRDLPASGQPAAQRLYQQDAALSWSRGYFSTQVRALKWQTLQDINAPIVPPYDRMPQVTASYTRVDAPLGRFGSGFDWSLEGDYTRFEADRSLTNQPNSNRSVTKAQIARPYLLPAGFITPKLQLHATSYQFDAPLADGSRSASRVVPTFSLDTGVQFERATALFGRNLTQTLEPRAFYVRTPYRDQSLLPNYDSGANSFNFASVFTENAFVGNDRISDANLLTLGVTSRLLDPDTGAEAARFGVAQRLRYEDQRVTLPGGLPITDRISDLLVGTSINWVPQWSFDGTVQYNSKTNQSDRSSFGVRYHPSDYRTVSAALRRQRGISQNVDVGWQWPINDLWGDKGRDLGAGQGQGPGRYYAVGRLNYSVTDKKLVDSILGVEYDGCCWIGRVVLQRSQNNLLATGASTGATNTQILFQLELVGFSRLGSSPLQTLKSNVPRYQILREKIQPPSRFTTYD
jgi:LPS-assembly protein